MLGVRGRGTWNVSCFFVVLHALMLAVDTSPSAVAAKVTLEVSSCRGGSLPLPQRRMQRLMLLLTLVMTVREQSSSVVAGGV